MMIDYEAVYIDKKGAKQSVFVTSTDVRTAINNLFELHPDAKRVVRCTPKPMFEVYEEE
jgi:hypothetical protein